MNLLSEYYIPNSVEIIDLHFSNVFYYFTHFHQVKRLYLTYTGIIALHISIYLTPPRSTQTLVKTHLVKKSVQTPISNNTSTAPPRPHYHWLLCPVPLPLFGFFENSAIATIHRPECENEQCKSPVPLDQKWL